MALRSLFIALSIFDDSVEGLEQFLLENEHIRSTIFDVDMKTRETGNDHSLLLVLTSLIKSSREFSLQQHEDALKNHPALKNLWREHETFLKSFLLKQCQIADLSFHGIFGSSIKKNDELIEMEPSKVFNNLQQSIGSGALLFSTLINHSCSNNVFRVYVEGKVVCIVCRPILKGSQLFDSYK